MRCPLIYDHLVCATQLKRWYINPENSGEQAGSGSLQGNIKRGGRGAGHPISHVLLPAAVTPGMMWKLSHGEKKLLRCHRRCL